MPDAASPQASAAGRVAALDWLRTLTIGYVVLYHVAQVLVRGGVNARPGDRQWLATAAVAATGLWRMPLMFLIAGASAEYVLRRKSWQAFVELRLRRLVVPAAFGLAVVIPALRYADAYAAESPLAFVPHAWTAVVDGGAPHWYHLWFVVDLTLLSLLALALRPAARAVRCAAVGRHSARAAQGAPTAAGAPGLGGRARRGRRASGAVFHAVGVSSLLVQAVPSRVFERLPALPGIDARQLLASGALFTAGVVIARRGGMLAAVARRRRATAVLAVGLGTLAGAFLAARGLGGSLLPPIEVAGRVAVVDEWAERLVRGGGAWFGTLAVLGYGYRYLTRLPLALRYLRDASFPVYLVHQAVLAWVVRALTGWEAPAVVEYAVLVSLTAAGSLAIYEYVGRRTAVGRFLLGVPPRAAPARPSAVRDARGAPASARAEGALAAPAAL